MLCDQEDMDLIDEVPSVSTWEIKREHKEGKTSVRKSKGVTETQIWMI